MVDTNYVKQSGSWAGEVCACPEYSVLLGSASSGFLPVGWIEDFSSGGAAGEDVPQSKLRSPCRRATT